MPDGRSRLVKLVRDDLDALLGDMGMYCALVSPDGHPSPHG